MPYDPDRHHRRSIRLSGYDYAGPGTYFITICTQDRALLFGEVVAGAMMLNDLGRIVQDEWHRSAEMRAGLSLDAFVVMPNHIHGLVTFGDPANASAAPYLGIADRIADDDRAHGSAPLRRPPRSLGSFVAGFKAATTTRISALRHTPGAPVWQRNYYEHIVRTDEALARIYNYIMTNPLRWMLDRENPTRWGDDDFDAWLGPLTPAQPAPTDRSRSTTPKTTQGGPG